MRPARFHGLPQQTQADGDGHDAPLANVLVDELAVARAARALLAKELPGRKVNVPVNTMIMTDAVTSASMFPPLPIHGRFEPPHSETRR